MKAEIISVGTELLLGSTINTDAADVAVAPQVHSAAQVALHVRARSPSVRSAMSTRSSRSMS